MQHIWSTIDQVGEPLFLTQYINSGDIETGRSMAQVDWTLLQGEYKVRSLIHERAICFVDRSE